MPAPKNPNTQNTEITLTLTFSAPELAQLEAFAALHGESVAAFIQNAALEAAGIAPTRKSGKEVTSDLNGLWSTDGFGEAPEPQEQEKALDLFAPIHTEKEQETVESTIAPAAASPGTVVPKRGVTGEQSVLAKGHGLVWEIRQALGRERVHGLGWTREQLAFVLKLSVVGVRKMEHLGTSPVKSLESRRALLGLAKTLQKPGEEICAYIEREEAALG